jgi:hypothetical protein
LLQELNGTTSQKTAFFLNALVILLAPSGLSAIMLAVKCSAFWIGIRLMVLQDCDQFTTLPYKVNNEYRYYTIYAKYYEKGHVAVLTQKLPKVHVLPELEISIYQPLEAHELVTG